MVVYPLDINGTRIFGMFHWKPYGRNRTSEKVIQFSRFDVPSFAPVPGVSALMAILAFNDDGFFDKTSIGTHYSRTEIPNRS